ncbi:MAG: hypothetical protein CFH16_01174, partial [Alphaproteobacteria bacterium MarineAlpha5_Bin6]
MVEKKKLNLNQEKNINIYNYNLINEAEL